MIEDKRGCPRCPFSKWARVRGEWADQAVNGLTPTILVGNTRNARAPRQGRAGSGRTGPSVRALARERGPVEDDRNWQRRVSRGRAKQKPGAVSCDAVAKSLPGHFHRSRHFEEQRR